MGAADTVHICQLDPGARLDLPWSGARAPLRATPTALGFYPEAHLQIVAVSRQVPARHCSFLSHDVRLYLLVSIQGAELVCNNTFRYLA